MKTEGKQICDEIISEGTISKSAGTSYAKVCGVGEKDNSEVLCAKNTRTKG